MIVAELGMAEILATGAGARLTGGPRVIDVGHRGVNPGGPLTDAGDEATTGVWSVPRRPWFRRLSATLLATVLPGFVPGPALATGANLSASAALENRGWINPALVPPPVVGNAMGPGTLAAEAWYEAPPGMMIAPPPWQVGAAAFGRMEVLGAGTAGATVQHGTAALARAVANATGRAEATLSASWIVDVVINPALAGPLVGPLLYEQLMGTLGCGKATVGNGGTSSGPARDFASLHLTQGTFHHTPGQSTAVASFEETATLSSGSAAASLRGGARFAPAGLPGSLGIAWSGGWSDADGIAMPLHNAAAARLFPAGDARNDLPDPSGLLAGVRLQSLQPLTVSSGFTVGEHYDGLLPLPFAR
jgi:hypothetical protein